MKIGKIFDCFNASNVPVYYGFLDIEKYVPKGSFIDFRDFKNYDTLYKYIKSMKDDEYLEYLQNIQNFIHSDKAKAFLLDTFIQTIFKEVL